MSECNERNPGKDMLNKIGASAYFAKDQTTYAPVNSMPVKMPYQNRSDLLFPIRRIEQLLSDDPLQMRRFRT